MAVENEPLRLRPHRIEAVSGDQWLLVRPDGRKVALPEMYRQFLQLVAQGMSLSAIAAWQRNHHGISGRFERVARFLIFLHDNDLLDDARAIELAETLRPDYRWRESIAFPEVFNFELFRLGERRPASETARWLVAVISVIAALFIVMRAWPSVVKGFTMPETAWPALGAFIIAFTVARSVRALLQAIFISIFAGVSVPLRIKYDFLSIALSTEEASRVRSDGAYAVASFSLLATVLVPAVPEMALLGVSSQVLELLPFFSVIVALCDLSPFRQSALTDCLRAYYLSLEDRHDRGVDELIKRLHFGLSFVWVFCLGFFVVAAGGSFVMKMGPLLRFDQLRLAVPAATVLLIFTLLLASFLDDIISGPSGENGAFSVRKLWHRNRLLESPLKETDRADLEELPLIRQFDRNAREHLLRNAKVVEVAPGRFVCRQGDHDRTLYIVLAGKFVVSRRTSSGRSRNVAVLERGAIFGEVSFFFGDRRTASVAALTEGRLLMIRHDPSLHDIDRARSAELQLRIWFLQGLVANPLFRELPAEAMDALAFAGERCEFRAGEKIIFEGERGESCYFIVQGQASVTKNFKLVNRLKRGDSFGEIALLKPELLRTATVTADTALTAVRIDGRRFWNLLSSHLPLAIALERVAEARLRNDELIAKAS